MNQIIHYFDLEDDEITAYVFEKESPTKQDNQNVKDGFHIVYPHVISKPDVQHIIRQNVIQSLTTNEDFANVPYKNTIEDVIDEAVIKRSGWMMYGSAKANQSPYLLTRAFDYGMNEIDLPNDIETIVLMMSIRNKYECSTLKVDINPPVSAPPTMPQVIINSEFNEDTNYAKELVSVLKPSRADSYTSWIEIGVCLLSLSLHSFVSRSRSFRSIRISFASASFL